jgi:hypothetical protein
MIAAATAYNGPSIACTAPLAVCASKDSLFEAFFAFGYSILDFKQVFQFDSPQFSQIFVLKCRHGIRPNV